MEGVKSWLSKNKGSTKNLSDDGSLKSFSPPSQRRYLFDRSDEEEEEEEKEEGGASLHYPRYRYNTNVKGRDGEDKPYETAS